MSISQEELQKIAERLSKLPGDNSDLLQNISDIVNYMDLLGEVDTTGVTPTISVNEYYAELHTDEIAQKEVSPSDLLNCSQQKVVGNTIVLPNIME